MEPLQVLAWVKISLLHLPDGPFLTDLAHLLVHHLLTSYQEKGLS
jgi:hypothetical protein